VRHPIPFLNGYGHRSRIAEPLRFHRSEPTAYRRYGTPPARRYRRRTMPKRDSAMPCRHYNAQREPYALAMAPAAVRRFGTAPSHCLKPLARSWPAALSARARLLLLAFTVLSRRGHLNC